MNKQEKIREGIRGVLTSPLPRGTVDSLEYFTTLMLRYLHSRGVVIKVERKLPWQCCVFAYACPLLKAGLVPIEPLTEE